MSRTLSSRVSAVGSELRRHRFGYLVAGSFALAGPFVARFLFPDASPAAGFIGGLLFGIYAALCAVPEKFLDE